MKRFILLGFILTLSSCFVYRPYSETVYTADFKPYTVDGFFITPASSINEIYAPIALVEINFTPGVPDGGTNWSKYYHPSHSEMLDKLVLQAKKIGGNALLDFKITIVYNYSKDGSTSINHYIASGYAVKIAQRKLMMPDSTSIPVTDRKYDIEKAFKIAAERNIPIVKKSDIDGSNMYFDPDSGIHISQAAFTQKYGYLILNQLQEVASKNQQL